jgi:hypothetical protein
VKPTIWRGSVSVPVLVLAVSQLTTHFFPSLIWVRCIESVWRIGGSMMRNLLVATGLLALFLGIACEAPQPSPREQVLEFVNTVVADSLPDISAYVDTDSLAQYLYS